MIEAIVIAAVVIAFAVFPERFRKGRGCTLAVMLVLIAVPMLRFGWQFNPVQAQPFFPESPAIERLQQEIGEYGRIARLGRNSIPPNVGQVLVLSDVNGASAAALAPYVRLVQAIDDRAILKQKYFRFFRELEILDSVLLDFLEAELVLGGPALPRAPAEDVSGPGFPVYRNPGRLPRFFLVDRVESHETADEGVSRFFSPGLDPRRVALVPASDVPVLSPGAALPEGAAPGSVEVISYGPHGIELAVAAEGDRLLVSSEVDYPGWEVEVDGVRVRKVPVNTAFRGVRVPAGEHTVRFRFVPRSFYLGLGLTFLALFGFAATHLPTGSRPKGDRR